MRLETYQGFGQRRFTDADEAASAVGFMMGTFCDVFHPTRVATVPKEISAHMANVLEAIASSDLPREEKDAASRLAKMSMIASLFGAAVAIRPDEVPLGAYNAVREFIHFAIDVINGAEAHEYLSCEIHPKAEGQLTPEVISQLRERFVTFCNQVATQA